MTQNSDAITRTQDEHSIGNGKGTAASRREKALLSIQNALRSQLELRDMPLVPPGQLSPADLQLLIEQAIVLFENYYVHLPLKRAMHAADPLQRLRLLRRRLAQFSADAAFHREMMSIFASVRDRHMNYRMPASFKDAMAKLPFRVECCFEQGRRHYIVADVESDFDHPTFGKGVEITNWNGVAIERAIELIGALHAGSNKDALHAYAIVGLTARSLQRVPRPDEDWVVVGYQTSAGSDQSPRKQLTAHDGDTNQGSTGC